MSARSLWLRIVGGWALASALLLTAAPSAPAASWRPPAAVVVGTAVGVALFLALGRGRIGGATPPRAATALVLVLAAGAEEVVWRWFALGELAVRAGGAAALVATTVLFTLAHRPPSAQQLAAGAAFAVVYLATGSLVGSWCAHGAYNLCVASARAGSPP